MDVSHTDHSHIIGKGGGNIKRGAFIFLAVSLEVCVVHFLIQPPSLVPASQKAALSGSHLYFKIIVVASEKSNLLNFPHHKN